MKLSPLAEKLYDKLNSNSHISNIEASALALYEDQTVCRSHREAYYEIWQYCQANPY